MQTITIAESMRMTVSEVFHLWFAGSIPVKLIVN